MNTDGLYSAVMNVPVVGVAMGLMFTYLIASLVSSAIKEAVASVFQWRGTYLQRGIGVLLSNTPGTAFGWGNLCTWLAAHVTWMDLTGQVPDAVAAATKAIDTAAKAISAAKAAAAAMVASNPTPAQLLTATAAVVAATTAGTDATAAGQAARAAIAKVGESDIAALVTTAIAAVDTAVVAVASRATADLAAAETAVATAKAALSVFSIPTHPLLKGTPTKLPSYVPARDFATAVLDMLRDGSASPVFSQVKRTVDALPDGDVKRILSAFIADAAGDLDRLRARIETWFDDAMDRLSGIYKRFAQYFLLALGLAIAVTLNVDSVHMAISLWQQPALRAQIVAQIQATVPPSKTGAANSTPAPATPAPATPATSAQAACPAVAASPTGSLTIPQAMQQVNCLPLPIGRPASSDFFGQPVAQGNSTPPWWQVWVWWNAWDSWTVLGWVITGIAISLGAPFWFGLLQNIMNLRAAGTPPQRADAQTASS
jgi:hypothetical protein